MASATHFFDLGDVILMEKPATPQFTKTYLTLQGMLYHIMRMQNNLEYILSSPRIMSLEIEELKQYIEKVEKVSKD